MVLRRWESEKKKVLSNELIKVELPPGRLRKLHDFSSVSPSSERRAYDSDEGLTLETSASLTFHGGNSTFINSFDKTEFFAMNDMNN